MSERYCSYLNQDVEPAALGEFKPVNIGPINIWPPVVLAPMAGITNAPFRTLCRGFGAGLYVSEMVTAMLVVRRHPKTLKMASFADNEKPRSVQLYGVDPHYMGAAAAQLVEEHEVDHIDLNFGCPVRKVTRSGGGAAIPVKPNLLRRVVRAAVSNAGQVPVTIKFRMGIDDKLLTYLDAGRIAEEEGCAAVALHARTAAQLYHGRARWEAIKTLKQQVTTIPVLGNGDIWEAYDALRMMRSTGCDGVVVGRGCLGRPWLFRDLVHVFEGRELREPPNLGLIADIMLKHARLLCQWFDERYAMVTFRKHCTWYIKGFEAASSLRARLLQIDSFSDLESILSEVNRAEPFPLDQLRKPRGKRNRRQQRVALPPGYLDDLEDATPPNAQIEEVVSGG